MVFCHTRGRGVSEGSEKTILLFWKSIFFSEHVENYFRTPKTCFTLDLKLFGYISSFKNYFEGVTE